MCLPETPSGLSKKTIEKIRGCIKKNLKVQKVVLYGSRAKGNYRRGSDVDLCFFGDDLDTHDLLKISDELDELLLPYTFDLSIYSKIENPEFKEHIDRVGVEFS